MKILVLAGGSDQCALVISLKNKGHDVILIDYFQDPPAKKYADKHYIDSTLNVDRVLEIAKIENVDLVTTACTDQALLVIAQVSEQLNLPCYISYQTALNVTNKAYMKNVFSRYDIPSSAFQIVDSFEYVDWVNLKFPLIVKPVDCNSSKGVKKIENLADAKIYLKEAIELSRTSTAIVEEFVSGVELSVDAYVDDEGVKLLSVTSSPKIKNQNSFTILQSIYPVPEVTEDVMVRIQDAAERISRAFKLYNCPLLIQLILSEDNNISIIEFSARMGGGSKYYLIETLSGVNIMEVYVDRILGRKPLVHPKHNVDFATMNYVYCKPGTFCQLVNFDKLKEQGVIVEFFQYKGEGSKIVKAETSSDRVAGFLLLGKTFDEISFKLKKANEMLQVLDSNATDVMKHDLFNF